MKTLKWAVLPACLLVATALTPARADDTAKTGFQTLTYKDSDGKEVKYVLFVPLDYKGDKPFPLILFLHGAGETYDGKNEGKQAKVGIGPAVEKQEKTFPAFVLMPQAQKRNPGWRADGEDAQRALDILKAVQKDYKIDDKRLYLTGLSMGGYGTWS